MIFLSEMFAAFVTAMMLENLLFARAIDIPGLYEKRSPQQILLIGSEIVDKTSFSMPKTSLSRVSSTGHVRVDGLVNREIEREVRS